VEALDYITRGVCPRDSKPSGIFLATVLRLFKSKFVTVTNVTAVIFCVNKASVNCHDISDGLSLERLSALKQTVCEQ
jgi:hypothetical protein